MQDRGQTGRARPSRSPCRSRPSLVRRAFAFSLAFHAGALFWFSRRAADPEPVPLPVELWSSVPSGGAGLGSGGRGAAAGPKPTLGELLDLGPSSGAGRGANGGGSGGAGGGSLDTLSGARAMRFEDEVALRPWIEEVWRRLDGAVDYPEDFVRRRISGSLRLQVELDGMGRLVGGFRRVSSDQKYLRAYTLACLSKALREAIPERLWRKQGMALALHFQFGTSASPGNADRDRGGVLRNQLTFLRLAYAKPEWEEKFERFFTKLVPPILPIPGGFIVDFVRLYRMVDEWGKEDRADIELARIEQMYRLLKSRTNDPSQTRK